jgi:hypothetical protein
MGYLFWPQLNLAFTTKHEHTLPSIHAFMLDIAIIYVRFKLLINQPVPQAPYNKTI